MYIRMATTIKDGYTALSAPARVETATLQSFFEYGDDKLPYITAIVVKARGNQSLLEPEVIYLDFYLKN